MLGIGQGGGDAMIDNWHAMEESGNYRKSRPSPSRCRCPTVRPARRPERRCARRCDHPGLGVLVGCRGDCTRLAPHRLGRRRHGRLRRRGGLHRRDPDRGVQHDAGHEHARNDDPQGASRPLRQGSRRLAFGEAAAMLIPEREEHAVRGAHYPRPRPRCRHHLTDSTWLPRPHRSG